MLVIALTPLVLVTRCANRATYRLGREIGRQARDTLTARAERELRLLVNSQARLLGSEGRLIGLAVEVQAREVEQRLADEPPGQARVWYAEDYDRGVDLPEGMAASPRHLRLNQDGERVPIPITEEEPVFRLAPGVEREAVADDVQRLAALTPVYRRLYGANRDVLYWIYTSLENGIHSCYPGHGGYPENYDHRERYWYQRAKQEAARPAAERRPVCWTPPYIEVSTRQPVLTAVRPVFRPGGEFAGAAAVDVAVADVVDQGEQPQLGSSIAQMVLLVPPREFDPHRPQDFDVTRYPPDELGLFILAQPGCGDGDTRWQTPFHTDWLRSEDGAEFAEMIRDMLAARAGIRHMAYDGKPHLWAYGQVLERTYLVVVTPCDEVLAEAVAAEQTILAETWHQLKRTAGLLLIVCGVIVALALVGSRTVTRPVRRLAEAAQRIAHGDFEARVDIDTRDELGELGRTFDEMVPQLQDRMRMRHSLALAMEVQQSLLPAGPPRIPGLDIAGSSIYCDETGGDYYDFLELSRLSTHELGIAVGDVTGHGIAAALLMTGARALLRNRANQPGSLSELMREVNDHLTEDTPVGRFMTLFYLVIDAQARSVRWANAGHDPPMLYDPATDGFDELGGGGIPLGIEVPWRYEEYRRDRLEAGQIIVIGTDGIWEAVNRRDQQFGKDALRRIIRERAEASAAEIQHAVIAALTEFRQGLPQADDVTLVVVKMPA